MQSEQPAPAAAPDQSGRAYPLRGRPNQREHCPSSQGAQHLRTSCAAPGVLSKDEADPARLPVPVAAVVYDHLSAFSISIVGGYRNTH
jgi:hypothetical protein